MAMSLISETLPEVLSRIADAARRRGDPPPTILTDLASAREFASVLAKYCGCASYTLEPRPGDCVAMFDGVQIIARYDRAPDTGFRKHFGVLAEIWSD